MKRKFWWWALRSLVFLYLAILNTALAVQWYSEGDVYWGSLAATIAVMMYLLTVVSVDDLP